MHRLALFTQTLWAINLACGCWYGWVAYQVGPRGRVEAAFPGDRVWLRKCPQFKWAYAMRVGVCGALMLGAGGVGLIYAADTMSAIKGFTMVLTPNICIFLVARASLEKKAWRVIRRQKAKSNPILDAS